MATTPPSGGNAAKSFMDLVHRNSYETYPMRSELTNFTFWAGAGFSKSWDPRVPLGKELFQLGTHVIEMVADTAALSRMFGLAFGEVISYARLRQIVYQLDMYDRYPEIRPRYVDEQNIKVLRSALRSSVVERYQTIAELNYFDVELGKFPCREPTVAQTNILRFFRYLFDQIDGSDEQAEGIRTQFVTTNYDFVIETILDNVLGPEDSLFLYTYRGFTPERMVGNRNLNPVHQHHLVWHLLKINGGFEILPSAEGYRLEYRRRSEEEVLDRPPVLMLPSREQDYRDRYFREVFPKAVRLLRETKVLVLVGYSLPEDDALIRFILRQFAEESEDGFRKAIYYVGPGCDTVKRKVVGEVFAGEHGEAMLSRSFYTFDGTFEEFATACLQVKGVVRP